MLLNGIESSSHHGNRPSSGAPAPGHECAVDQVELQSDALSEILHAEQPCSRTFPATDSRSRFHQDRSHVGGGHHRHPGRHRHPQLYVICHPQQVDRRDQRPGRGALEAGAVLSGQPPLQHGRQRHHLLADCDSCDRHLRLNLRCQRRGANLHRHRHQPIRPGTGRRFRPLCVHAERGQCQGYHHLQ